MDLGSLFDSGLTGGLFGLLGNVAGKVIGLVESRQVFAQKKEEWTHDERLLDLQMKAKAAEAGQALAVNFGLEHVHQPGRSQRTKAELRG